MTRTENWEANTVVHHFFQTANRLTAVAVRLRPIYSDVFSGRSIWAIYTSSTRTNGSFSWTREPSLFSNHQQRAPSTYHVRSLDSRGRMLTFAQGPWSLWASNEWNSAGPQGTKRATLQYCTYYFLGRQWNSESPPGISFQFYILTMYLRPQHRLQIWRRSFWSVRELHDNFKHVSRGFRNRKRKK